MKHNPFKIQEGTVRDRKISGYNAVRHEGDNFLFLPDFTSWIGKNLTEKNIAVFYTIVSALFLILVGRVMYMQVVRGERYVELAEENRLKVVTLRAPRGILYDRYERPFVENVSRFVLSVNPRIIQSDQQASELAQYLSERFPDERARIGEILGAYRTHNRIERIAVDIPYERAIELLIKASDNAALQVTYEPERRYVAGVAAAHVLGYVSDISPEELVQNPQYELTDVIGKNGIESRYESVLRGTDGSSRIEVDARGREKGVASETPPRQGSDIILTIDSDAQQKLFEILERTARANGGKPAAGVALDPHTGEILALVSVPSYDNALFSGQLRADEFQRLLEDDRKPLFMRTIAGTYPAGSVFKLIVASAALEEGFIDDRFAVNSTGGIRLGDRFYPDWRAGGHGRTNIYKAIADSVNTFFYIVGGGSDTLPGLGIDVIERYARRFGLGAPTGIDLPGESAGFVPSRAWKEGRGERWYQGDTYNIAIGQGSLLVTPLQVSRFTAAFANAGILVEPHLVKYYRGQDGVPVIPRTIRSEQLLRSDNLAMVKQGMRETVLSGTARSLQSVGVPVAGKTGTAQFDRQHTPHSWFTGFAPYDDASVVITILVEEGGDQGYAVSAARQFLEWFFAEGGAQPRARRG